jgi:WD40 repeat protein
LYFAVKNNKDSDLLVTAGTNGYLNIWNTKTHRDSHSTLLEALPSYLTFSQNDKFLAVGLRNGKVLLFTDSENSEFELMGYVQGNENNETPAVLRIIFSQNCNLMAVSYLAVNSSSASKDLYAKRGGYIIIYELKNNTGNKKITSLDYTQKTIVWNHKCNMQEKTNSIGCYHMTFDLKLDILVAIFQSFDNYLNRDLDDKEKNLLIYNLNTESEETNKDLLKKISLLKFDFPDSVNCLSRILVTNQSENEKQFQNKQTVMSSVLQSKDLELCMLGSSRGEINIVKSSFL